MPPTATAKTRHGEMTYWKDDAFVGKSLALYGEYSPDEVTFLRKVLRPGDVAIDVGANIGALTVEMSHLVSGGQVYAFEANPDNYELLLKNVNGCALAGVKLYRSAVTDHVGTLSVEELDTLGHTNYGRVSVRPGAHGVVSAVSLDRFKLDKVRLIKIDVEGHELEVIRGARETIKRCRPIIYVENDRPDRSAALIAELVDLGYWLWWHRPPLFRADNFAGNPRNVFGPIVSHMMIGAPEDSGVTVDGCADVADLRDDEQMFTREAIRYKRAYERTKNLEHRLMAAHYWNLMQRGDIAEQLINRNLRADPHHAPTLGIKAMHDLQAGRWEEGWKGYELRYSMREKTSWGGARKFDVPHWDGARTEDTVLIWAEQGFGDTIMFARFVKYARRLAPNLVLEVPPELYELFATSWVAIPPALFRARRAIPHDIAAHCSLPSLPATLGARGARMTGSFNYLHADIGLAKHWREERKPPKIGICLSGSPRSERPYTRDCPVELFEKLAERHGPFFNLEQAGQFESFADTAAAIEALDLVITVDTSIAHLAGALGKPTWLLLSFDPDWRWGMHGEHADLWYPSMTVFRQKRFRDWAQVVADVDMALTERVQQAQACAAE